METRYKRRKIQEIASLLSQVSSASEFESLSDDTLGLILQFVGRRSYVSFARINKRCKGIYLLSGMPKETFRFGYGTLSAITKKCERAIKDFTVWKLGKAIGKGVIFHNRKDVLDWALQQQKKILLKGICDVAGNEGKIDILKEVFQSVVNEDDNECIFGDLDESAAWHGRLDLLNWINDNDIFPIDKAWCAHKAAFRGHLHVIEWLWVKGLRFSDEYLLSRAINSGHLNVLKWLREKGCPWNDYHTFMQAAKAGNLEVLQWLHDEGCPWNSSHQVLELNLKPEAKDWLFAHGYRNRVHIIHRSWE